MPFRAKAIGVASVCNRSVAPDRRARGRHRHRAYLSFYDRHRRRQCRRAGIPEPDHRGGFPRPAAITARSTRNSSWNSCRSRISGSNWRHIATHDILASPDSPNRNHVRGAGDFASICANRFLDREKDPFGMTAGRGEATPTESMRRRAARVRNMAPNSRWRSIANWSRTLVSRPST